MRNWLAVCAVAALELGNVAPVAAAGPAVNASEADAAPCVEVEVNGERAPSFPCLTQKLQPTNPARPVRPDSGLAAEAITQRPSNQLGLYNQAGTSHRMGNTFGTSVYPQRPANPVSTAPVIPHAQP
ncbi:hypothetical protein PO002_24060 [Cupriavidus necator]|uniref:hypothetical protein n=1 Tax=Cupriavidus necator TaxID=106590 RepID=UPI0039C2AE21